MVLFVALLNAGGCRTAPVVISKKIPESSPEISPSRELRGLWVTRWDYKTADDVRRIVGEADAAGFNTLFWQVRGQADAFYHSELEPWGAELTGQLGRNPGFDPLRVALDEAHAHGLQLHAWINIFAMWKGETPPPASVPEHIFRAHPEWLAADDKGQPIGLSSKDYAFASPGNPAAREHVAAVVRDLAGHYEIDGLHLDYIRYGGRQYSHDTVSLRRFAEAQAGRVMIKGLRATDSVHAISYADWQREQVSETVRLIRHTLRGTRPAAQLSAAVWGVYRNQWNWPGVSQGYSDYYQDPREWLKRGYVDFVCPMVYWPMTKIRGEKLDWLTLTADHVGGCGRDRVMAGITANHDSFAEISREIDEARRLGAHGVVIFAYSTLAAKHYLPALAAGPFRQEAPGK